MRNYYYFLTFLLVFVLTGCNKIEDSKIEDSKIDAMDRSFDNDTITDINPYNHYNGQIDSLVINMIDIITENPGINYVDYAAKITLLLDSYNYSIWNITESELSMLNDSITKDLFSSYLSDIATFGLAEATNISNLKVYAMNNEGVKNIYYKVISQLRLFMLSVSNHLPEYASMGEWDELWNDCMEEKLNNIFNGNWIEQMQFIAGLPGSMIWIVASCIWNASTGYE